MTRTCTLGADIGGTIADIVLRADDETNHLRQTSSTPQDYGVGILTGALDLLARVGADPAQVQEIIHATIVATNTVLEGKGARTALVSTMGFRDVVEIGRLRVPQLYDLNYAKPVPLAARRHRYQVEERMPADRSVLIPIATEELDHIADQIRAAGVEAVVICFLPSYANPAHEELAFVHLAEAPGPHIYRPARQRCCPRSANTNVPARWW